MGKAGTALVAGMLALASFAAESKTEFRKLERPPDERRSVLFINPQRGYVEPQLLKELTDAGYIVDAADTDGLELDRLRRFNTVVIESWDKNWTLVAAKPRTVTVPAGSSVKEVMP